MDSHILSSLLSKYDEKSRLIEQRSTSASVQNFDEVWKTANPEYKWTYDEDSREGRNLLDRLASMEIANQGSYNYGYDTQGNVNSEILSIATAKKNGDELFYTIS